MRPIIPGLADEKLELVQDFLDSIPNAMHFEQLDGFFCALICGPTLVPAREYLPYIFGGQMPNFETEEKAQEIMSALAEHWKFIGDSLAEETPYYPFLYADEEEKCAANDWADAFMFGVQLRQQDWQPLYDDTTRSEWISPIIQLRNELHESEDGKTLIIPSEDREQFLSDIVQNMIELFNYHADLREAAEEDSEAH